MESVHQPLPRWLIRTIRKPGFWLILASLALITIPHYASALGHPTFINQLLSQFGLTRQAFERILYLAPIVWAGFIFGWQGAVITSLAAFAAMLPRALLFSPYRQDAIFETVAVFIIGNVLAISFNALRKERERRVYLTALNRTSSVVSRSLELSEVLNSSIDTVISVMGVDAALIFLLDEEAGELALTAHQGISPEFARGVDRLKLGEGFNGRVAASGEPLFVEDASQDHRLTRTAVKEYEIRSEIIVPLRSKEKVIGTLCAATHSKRWFQMEEIQLLTAIGNQIGVAVENAHLYLKQHEITEQLRVSEERFRELFESAHDAIWLHNLEGDVIAANKAAGHLTGYSLAELTGMNVKSFLSTESLNLANQVRRQLLASEPVVQPYEQHLTRRDGSEAFIELTTSLLLNKGKVVAFQHVARDVTEQKRLQENQRFYLEQATRAQEEERKRISRELHDDTVQSLVVLSRQLDNLATNDKSLSEETRRRLEELREQTNNIMLGVRRLGQDLRPAALDRLGLLPALEWLAADVTKYSGVATAIKILGSERRFPEEIELVLFRITQEALRNVWRHSKASRAEIIVEFNQNKTGITISDNGQGFNPPAMIGGLARDGKLGLAGMHERARLIGGTLTVDSQPGKGTSVKVELPA